MFDFVYVIFPPDEAANQIGSNRLNDLARIHSEFSALKNDNLAITVKQKFKVSDYLADSLTHLWRAPHFQTLTIHMQLRDCRIELPHNRADDTE